ncbi:hypothetical protein [Streptomyces celluloflavus]|uniref:hypothetical protein n=1 Tax=Streptomyces celluloflavus TaxID=58344 RepID=UPI003692248F
MISRSVTSSAGPRGEQVGFDPVRVRVPAPLAKEVPQLLLGGLLPRRHEYGKSPAHPSPDRNTGLLLSFAERRADPAAAVTDDDLAQLVLQLQFAIVAGQRHVYECTLLTYRQVL